MIKNLLNSLKKNPLKYLGGFLLSAFAFKFLFKSSPKINTLGATSSKTITEEPKTKIVYTQEQIKEGNLLATKIHSAINTITLFSWNSLHQHDEAVEIINNNKSKIDLINYSYFKLFNKTIFEEIGNFPIYFSQQIKL